MHAAEGMSAGSADTGKRAMGLTNQVAVVTGASSGIGRAIVHGLAEQGAEVCLIGRRAEAIEETIATAPAGSAGLHSYEADLRDDGAVEAFCSQVKRDHQHVDILVHSAGAFARGSLETSPIEDLDLLYQVNLRAPCLVTHHLLPLMKRRRVGFGQIVFINSTAGITAFECVGYYAATKFGLRAVADSLRREVRSDRIRVMTAFPGRVATPMQEEVCRQEGKPYNLDAYAQPRDVASVVVNALLLPATAEVPELVVGPFRKA